MARVRTFIAVDIGEAIRDRAISLQEHLAEYSPDVKWVEADNLHVTLLFLGEVSDRQLVEVCRAVQDAASQHAPFAMTIEKTGCFPNPRRPRVLWVGVGAGSDTLCKIHDGLETSLLDLGCYRREERKYTPHITLGRVRTERPADSLANELARQANWRGGQIEVAKLLVMSSEPSSEGPKYGVLSRAKLGAK